MPWQQLYITRKNVFIPIQLAKRTSLQSDSADSEDAYTPQPKCLTGRLSVNSNIRQ